MSHDLLDLALLLQLVQRLASQRAVDLQPVDQRRDRDEPVGLHVFVEFVRGGFVEDDGVVGFVLDCGVEREGISFGRRSTGRTREEVDRPLPLDHFFFCFLPPLVAAGA